MANLLTELPFGLPGRIFRSPLPYGDFDPTQQVIHLYKKEGVHVVVMLVSSEEAKAKTGRDLVRLYKEAGLDVITIPIPDFSVPALEPFWRALKLTQAQARAGQNVAVHCNAGIGRTGLFMACLTRQILGFSGEEAVVWVRKYIDKAIENQTQLDMVLNINGN
jgi:protein-tyrosine phosphatase